MNCNIITNENRRCLDYTSCMGVLASEQDAVDLISSCWSNNADTLLLHEQSVATGFFQLKTGLAGEALRKFQMYHIKVALVVQNTDLLEGRFGEMAMEANKGSDFRIYDNTEAATEWLLVTYHDNTMQFR